MVSRGADASADKTTGGIKAGSSKTLGAISKSCFKPQLIQTHRPEAVGVERLFFNKNVQTAMAVGQARGVVLFTAAQHGLPVLEYGPHEVKLAVTGYGKAPKDQVQRMVQMVLAMKQIPKPDDAADALAVAVCTAHAIIPGKAVHA